MSSDAPTGPLKGLKVLDLSRILAGPTCTQLLGDLGADVVKVERPGVGDDTRKWGPPYVTGRDGEPCSESAYYLCANRNKRSAAIDMSQPEGQALLREMAAGADIVVENFKTGGLAKYGLAYDDLKESNPGLIYCSITGFGQTGPYAHRGGYDFLIQAMGGIMSITGEPDGDPHKVGLGIADVMCGMYATIAILAALRHRDATGEGQSIDLALLDTQVAWLINAGLNYLTSGEEPPRYGNGHPNIVPYDVFPTSDGYMALAVGNDAQFQRFCDVADVPELASDPDFATNDQRVRNRESLTAKLRAVTVSRTREDWLSDLEDAGVPCGPVNSLKQVFEDPQVLYRGMRLTMPYPTATDGVVELIGNPIAYSATPVNYRYPPPTLGEHTLDVLDEWLGLDASKCNRLKGQGVIR